MMRMLQFPLFDNGGFGHGSVTLEIPASNGMECVGMQDGTVMLWQLCDDRCAPRRRRFLIAGTGQVLPEGGIRYLGTVFDRVFVWHLFEVLCD